MLCFFPRIPLILSLSLSPFSVLFFLSVPSSLTLSLFLSYRLCTTHTLSFLDYLHYHHLIVHTPRPLQSCTDCPWIPQPIIPYESQPTSLCPLLFPLPISPRTEANNWHAPFFSFYLSMHIPEYPQTKGSGCYTLLILLSILSMYIPLRIVFLLSMLFSRSRHLRDSPAVSFHTRHKDQTPFLARVNASSTAVSYITQPILVLCCFFLYFFSYRQERGRWISSLYFF